MLRAIKIIHSWNQIKEYRFLSDYFRMMGIYICGYTPQTDCLSSDFDVVIILKKDMDKNDVEMLEDLLVAAVNEALDKVDEASAASMSKFTGGMNGLL